MGPRQGRWRHVRTGVFALVCLALAVGAHAAAGGGLPPPGVLLLAALPLWLGGAVLTGRQVRFGTLTCALGAAQLGLHLLFHATAGGPAGHLGAGLTVPAGAMAHAGHAAAPVAGSPALAPQLAGGLSPAMLLAHALATAACAVVMTRAEELLWRLLRRVVRNPPSGRAPVTAPLWRLVVAPAVVPAGRLLSPGRALRGPPALPFG